MKYRSYAFILSLLLSCNLFAANLSISEIRSEYKLIRDELSSLSQIQVEMDSHSTEGGKAIGYIDNDNQIRLIRVELYGESGNAYEEYYYLNGELFFAFYESHRFNAPYHMAPEVAKDTGGVSFDPAKTKVYENRYYFSGKKLVRWLDPDKKPKDGASIEFIESEQSVNQFSDMVYKLVSHKLATNSVMTLQAENFYVEDESLASIPDTAETVIRSSGEPELSECELIGKAVDLDGDKEASDLIVTTKDACIWGAAVAPIWILKKSNSTYSVVLDFASYSFELSKYLTNGLRDITLTSGTAGYSDVVVWEYDGEQYTEAGTYHFDASDVDACKARPDICPFEIEDEPH